MLQQQVLDQVIVRDLNCLMIPLQVRPSYNTTGTEIWYPLKTVENAAGIVVENHCTRCGICFILSSSCIVQQP